MIMMMMDLLGQSSHLEHGIDVVSKSKQPGILSFLKKNKRLK